jgi:hypothetical protein
MPGVLYLLNQRDVLGSAIPGFPVWDLAGLLGSTDWGLWVAALGVTVLLRRVRVPHAPLPTPDVNLYPSTPAVGPPAAGLRS